jgi:dTDP-4-dehydrorhamnose reductase
MLKIAVTGSTGLIGSRIIELLNKDFQFIPLLQKKVNITNRQQTDETISNIDFDILLHLAAYTDVDGTEKNKEAAYRINVEGTRNIFEAVNAKKKKFIYISTDFVFDGKQEKAPFYEDSIPNPISYYGQTKYEGEKIVNSSAGGRAMIVRFSYPYRANFEQKKDFVRNIKSQLEQGKSLQMVTDSTITPTFIDDIAFVLKYLFNNYSPEIYHVVGGDSLSPYDAGKLIAKTFNLNQSLIQPTTYEVYFKDRAKRPQYSEIKSKKNNFYKMKTFEEGLNEIRKQTIENR